MHLFSAYLAQHNIEPPAAARKAATLLSYIFTSFAQLDILYLFSFLLNSLCLVRLHLYL